MRLVDLGHPPTRPRQQVVGVGVRARLGQEGVEIEAADATTGEVHEHPAGDERVVADERCGPVAGELGAPVPLEEHEDHRLEGQPADRGDPGDDERLEDLQHRRVVDVVRKHVALFVGEDRGELDPGKPRDEPRVQDDHRARRADGEGVHVRQLAEVEVGPDRKVERAHALEVALPYRGELSITEADGVRQQELLVGALEAELADLFQDLLEERDRPERGRRRPV